jgi:hypothetical protein
MDFDDIIEIFEYIRFSTKINEELINNQYIKNIIIYLSKILFNKINKNKIHIIIPILCDYYSFLFDLFTYAIF